MESQAVAIELRGITVRFGPFTAVQSLKGDQGARVLLRAPATQATPVALPAAGHDLDAPDDLAHFRRLCRRVRH